MTFHANIITGVQGKTTLSVPFEPRYILSTVAVATSFVIRSDPAPSH